MSKFYFSLISMLFVLNMAKALPAEGLTVAVASNFESTFKQLQPLFEEQYKIVLNPSFASTGTLYTQIVNGAPFDVFLSGDKEHVAMLETKGLSKSSTSFIYAIGELIVFAPGKNIAKDGLMKLSSFGIKKIAIANPKTAPYGLAAMQVLQKEKKWDVLQYKLVVGENVGQVATFLITRNADVGFLANSQFIDMMKHMKRSNFSDEVWKVPSVMYTPLSQYATLLISTHSQQDAELFLNFLKTQAAKEIISGNGYHFQ